MCFGMPATIIGTTGDDTLTGTPGDDVIVGLEGTDEISSTSGGFDRVCAGPNDLDLGAGGVPRYETISFSGSGFVDGGPGLDSIGGGFVDGGQILGGSNPTVRDARGRLWRERIVVGIADGIEISSGDGPDRVDVELDGGGGRAKVDAGAGHDLVTCSGDFASRCEVYGGGPGSDTVRAGGGSDKAWGGDGRDVLVGADGRDSLYGGAGVDDNYGGTGSDLCRSPQSGPRAHSCQR